MGQVGNKEIIGAQYGIPQFRLIISLLHWLEFITLPGQIFISRISRMT